MFRDVKKNNTSVCTIDVETTGLSPLIGNRVIEIAAVRIENWEITSEFQTLINVPCRLHRGAMKVHHITKKMLKGEPSPGEVWERFIDFVGKSVLIAHNAEFDMRFIKAELSLLGLTLQNRSKCTLKMARGLYPRLNNYRLETVARHVLGSIPFDCSLHRALGDARLVAYIWLTMEGKH